MAKTKVFVIHDAATGEIKRIFIPSHHDSEIQHQHVLEGESCTPIPLEEFNSGGPNLMTRVAAIVKGSSS